MNATQEQIDALVGTLETLVAGIDNGEDDATIRNYITIQARAVVKEFAARK